MAKKAAAKKDDTSAKLKKAAGKKKTVPQKAVRTKAKKPVASKKTVATILCANLWSPPYVQTKWRISWVMVKSRCKPWGVI